MQFEELNQLNYISVQPAIAGFDEVQQLALAYVNGCHVACSGSPALGKTLLIEEFARLVNQDLISRVMGPKVNESMLISYPDLVHEKGTPVTVTRLGLLATALKRGAIYYADEIDRLSSDNQKLHNSAFDQRRSVTLRNGSSVKGQSGFFGVIAYNPSSGSKSDLEPSLADRFVHLNFDYYPPEVESLISLRQSGLPFNEIQGRHTSWRAILYRNSGTRHVQFFDLVQGKRGKLSLVNPATRKSLDISGENAETFRNNLFVYCRYEPPRPVKSMILPSEHRLEELSLKLAEFSAVLRSLTLNGISQLGEEFIAQLDKEKESLKVNRIRLHIPTARIHQAGLKHYHTLVNQMGYPRSRAQEYAVHLMINQAGYGKYGTHQYGSINCLELLRSIAGCKGLLPMRKQRQLSN